jgi:hypothetical protein
VRQYARGNCPVISSISKQTNGFVVKRFVGETYQCNIIRQVDIIKLRMNDHASSFDCCLMSTPEIDRSNADHQLTAMHIHEHTNTQKKIKNYSLSKEVE